MYERNKIGLNPLNEQSIQFHRFQMNQAVLQK
jgi:hypothetical protein